MYKEGEKEGIYKEREEVLDAGDGWKEERARGVRIVQAARDF